MNKLDVSVETLLKRVGGSFQQIIQWNEGKRAGWSESVTANYHKAEAILEIIEIADCGSIGGFGKGQPYPNGCPFKRWDWLLRKYVGDPKGLRFGCDIASYERIQKFFTSK